MPTDPKIQDDERDDDESGPQERRIAATARVADRVAARMDRIQAKFAIPPDPVVPQTIADLNTIIAASNHTILVADALLAKLRR